MMKPTIITWGLLFSTQAFALIAGPATIKGVVKSFDKKTVVLENDENRYEVPRDFVSEKDLRAETKLEVLMSQEQVEKVKIRKKNAAK